MVSEYNIIPYLRSTEAEIFIIGMKIKSLSTGGPGRRDTCRPIDFSQTFTDD